MLGDTDNSDLTLTDEEIAYFLSTEGNALAAAVAGVSAIIAKYGRLVDTTTGSISKSYSQLVASFKTLKDELEKKLASGAAPVFDDYVDTDPKFTVDMMENNTSS